MVVYRGVNNGLLYDLWNSYNLDDPPLGADGDGGSDGLMGFVTSGIEEVPPTPHCPALRRALLHRNPDGAASDTV